MGVELRYSGRELVLRGNFEKSPASRQKKKKKKSRGATAEKWAITEVAVYLHERRIQTQPPTPKKEIVLDD